MKCPLFSIALLLLSIANSFAQIPTAINIQILKAEDSRRYDKTLEDLMNSADERVKIRAMLAAGRIGDEKAIPRLASMLESGSMKVREMAAFALGEIESTNAAAAILKALKDPKTLAAVRARAVEAAGKIAAANAKDANAKELGEAILDTLEAEDSKGNKQDRDVVLLALTAALRARPEDADLVVMKFLTNLDSHIRADAANTLARLRTKSANTALRAIVMSDDDPVARANAVRALGAAEDKESLNILIDAATEDDDSRVRVAAIRSLGSLKDAKAATRLLARGDKLLAEHKRSKFRHPVEKSELLEIASAIGRLLPKTSDKSSVTWLKELQAVESSSSEVESALALIAPKEYFGIFGEEQGWGFTDFRIVSARVQGIRSLSAEKDVELKRAAFFILTTYAASATEVLKGRDYRTEMTKALPETARTWLAFEGAPGDIPFNLLMHRDVFVRATAAELIADQPKSNENTVAMKNAFAKSLVTDRHDNDAQLAILDALYKLDKKESVGSLLPALNATDYLVRKKAFDLLADKDLQKEFPNIVAALETARKSRKDQVLRYNPKSRTKLGQVLNSDSDYRRALSRKNGSVKAVLTTEKGTFTIDFYPEQAPLTVDNFVKLAKSRYFNGIEVHRVVPNFVMQDGDPRGDGNGGPGWSIRCEVNMLPYDRGAVGMALSGKDTGGSQWFVTHSPQPHLDGGYTVFGRVNEKDMKVVDNIVRGDKIISVKIIEGLSTQRSPRTRRKK